MFPISSNLTQCILSACRCVALHRIASHCISSQGGAVSAAGQVQHPKAPQHAAAVGHLHVREHPAVLRQAVKTKSEGGLAYIHRDGGWLVAGSLLLQVVAIVG
mgnify:CR=1 FL=1